MPLTENLRRDHVVDLNPKPAPAVPPNCSIADAIRLMQKERVGCVLVEKEGGLMGILTERDVLKRIMGQKTDIGAMISTVMTPNPATVTVDDTIGDALKAMLDGGYRNLPVVDKRGRAVGRISVREIVHYMVEHFPKAVYNLPPNPDQVQLAPEGA